MIEDHYPKFKKIINEFEQDQKQFSSDKEIISYFPQIFLLAIVSTFEKEIKEKCANIITHPAISLTPFVRLNQICSTTSNYSDKIYSNFKAYEQNGILTLNANDFYSLFGGVTFRTDVETNFFSERQQQINDYRNLVEMLLPLIEKDDKYDDSYIENDDICNIFNSLNFCDAERAFLELKFRRNKVAHNFLTGISDSFEDIRLLYYKSVLYVVAVKRSLSNLSTV